jgi:multiple sugar transport system substrate-binding protein
MIERASRFDRRTVLKGGLAGAAALATGIYAPYVLAQNKSLSIMVLGPTQQSLEWLRGALAQFKTDSGYDVELRQTDWGSAFQTLLTSPASGTMADVTMMGQVMTPALASKGAYLAIDDRLADWPDVKAYYPAMLKDGTYDGKSYALPASADVRTAVYRSDILEKVGVGADALPKNWDEFKAVAKKLSKKEGGPLDTPFFSGQDKSVGLMQIYSQMLYQARGTFFDDAGKSVLSNEAGVKALDYLVSFFTEGLANPNVVYQGTGPRPLVQGLSAMTYNSAAESQNAADNAPDIQKFIVAGPPLSAEAGGEPATIAWVNKFAIGSNTKDPDGAWELLKFIMSKENSAKIAELWGGLPARTDQKDAPYLANVSPGFVEATQYAGALPTSPNLLQIQKEVNIALQGAIRQSGGSAQILAALDKKIDTINGV